ncbi:hypothetical protein [Streptomyces sp. cmx-10-25]|uniref:hypothetical protein n=1 Tax=Streptomyces sp. cmx-10-25 TaxID=2790919 RepID=UPI0039804DDE
MDEPIRVLRSGEDVVEPALLVPAAAAPARPAAHTAAGPTAYDVNVQVCAWNGSVTDDNV